MTARLAAPVAPARPAEGSGSGYVHGLDAVRVVASLAVIYQHLSSWLVLYGHRVPLREALDASVMNPLRLDDPLSVDDNVGFIGVALFFLVSGFVINQAIGRERIGQFLGRRASRLLLPLWIAVTLAWVLVSAGLLEANRAPHLGDLFTNLFLLNYWVAGSHVLQPTWTLGIEFVFYFLAAATIPLHRRWPWLAPALAATLVSVTISLVNTEDTPATAEIRTVAMFLPILFIGQLISLVRSGGLTPPAGLAFGTVQFGLFLLADATTTDSTTQSGGPPYVRVVLLAIPVVLLAVRARGRIVRARWVGALARRTYSVYLMHMPLAFPVLTLLVPRVGDVVAVAVALVVVAAGTEVVHRFVETPMVNWYRRRERGPGGSGS